TPRERYEMLLQRCPGIMEFLDLQDIASFLNVHPNTVSKIRRDITFGDPNAIIKDGNVYDLLIYGLTKETIKHVLSE
ncbi:MAG: hypothetical protein J6I61_08920, partial [Prevotella sp.]|nr:hypothetical protein [Prevotella sp.]